MQFRIDGIVNTWTCERTGGIKIVAEYEIHGIIPTLESIPFGNEYIAIIAVSIIELIIIVKRKSIIKRY